MKKTALMIALLAATLAARAAIRHEYSTVYFNEPVFLHDDTDNALHTRMPPGSALTFSDGVLHPVQDFIVQGGVIIETNKTLRMRFKPEGVALGFGIEIDSAGTITLRRHIGAEWVETVITAGDELGGDPATWSEHAASQDVDLDNNELDNVAAINLGGTRRTTWPTASADASSWSEYPATETIDAGGNAFTNVSTIAFDNSSGAVITNNNTLAIKAESTLMLGQAGRATSVEGTVTIHGGVLSISDLPTSDPTTAGRIWNDEGTLKVSSGE